MKRSLLIATGLVLLSTSAFATTSRMTALGESDSRGSHYIDDSRNVFRNAAHAGTMTNYTVMEWSTTGNGGSDGSGGFFKEAGSFNYGVYLNDTSDSQNAVAKGTSNYGGANIGLTGLIDRSDNVDLFFAGDMGFQWGARIGYAASSNKSATASAQEQKHSGMSLGAGAVFGDIEGSINFVLKDEYENASNTSVTASGKAEGSMMDIALAYHWGSWTFYGNYDSRKVEVTSATVGLTKGETKRSTITVGAGHIHEVSSTARIYSDVEYMTQSGETKAISATTKSEAGTDALSLNVAFEADATSWLTWRGSVSQNILIDKDTTKAATAGSLETEVNDASTRVRAGATLNFGKLKVDGNIGSTNDDLSLSTVLTEVAVHYWF
ncbi:MAG: hypothetical protein CME70_21065 [Halobacteriovorax sp.]|nr:hypothetical protein [Halobacteriovorax sp.]|tara:strand:- start:69662 stop:70801 length:1140 start_codon:yes stop_codon:yes gene_type:complete